MEEPIQTPPVGKVKKGRLKRTIWIILGVLFIALVVGIIYVNAYINKSLPQVEGEINLPSLQNSVTVIRDDEGVPHIKAKNEHDLYLAQGYVQAQDRMFQMELSRRQASGTLSEVVGDKAVNRDKYFRTLGLRRAAEKSWDAYSEQGRDTLEWFADGVNAYIKQAAAGHTFPVEFKLLGIDKPAKWTPIDSLTIGKYMAFDLGGHWERQAFDYYLMNHFDDVEMKELLPTYPEHAPTIIKDDEVHVAEAMTDAVIPHAFNGSNDWVVSGKKTKSGKPLLANDPHLGLATPSVWYQMHLEANDLNVEGVIFAGVPGIILGHNENIAWGVTNTGPDVQQLYLEKRNPNDTNEFKFDGKWEKADVIDEPIKVKGGGTIDYHVTVTRHGPVVSEFAGDSGKDKVLSLRWTALDKTTELEAILELNKASNWKEFEHGLEKFLAPAQNFVFAGKDGTIAYKANGKIPIYEDGDDALFPLPGWDKKYLWKGYIPFDELPTVVNPDKGYIATANNKIVGDEYPYHISNVWAQPYRYERIEEVLKKGNDLTVQDMKDLQMDQTDLQAREFVPVFLDALKDTPLTKKEEDILQKLADWDDVDGVHDAAPLIFYTWFANIEDQLYTNIPDSMMSLFEGRQQTTDSLLRKGDQSEWMKDQGGMEQLLHHSLTKTVDYLVDEYGSDTTDWEWGKYHQVQFYHPLSQASAILAYFFNHDKPIPVGGSNVTPMAASFEQDTGIVDHGASWRFVIDANDLSKGYHIVGPGEAGHFRSPWYHDQMADWVDGNYHETVLNDPKGKKLTLQPE